MVTMKDVLDRFRFSEFYSNMTKKEKKKLTYKKFQQQLRENIRLKHHCTPSNARVYWQDKQYRNIVTGWRLKTTCKNGYDSDSD